MARPTSKLSSVYQHISELRANVRYHRDRILELDRISSPNVDSSPRQQRLDQRIHHHLKKIADYQARIAANEALMELMQQKEKV